jgi:hypothetical protein
VEIFQHTCLQSNLQIFKKNYLKIPQGGGGVKKKLPEFLFGCPPGLDVHGRGCTVLMIRNTHSKETCIHIGNILKKIIIISYNLEESKEKAGT